MLWTHLDRLFKFFRQPFAIFWLYYLIGPIVALIKVYEISSIQGLFKEEDMFEKLAVHIIGYLSLFPIIFYCAKLKLSSTQSIIRIKPKAIIIIPGIILFFTFLYLTYTAFDFANSNFFLPDKIRAEIYRDWIYESKVMPLILISLILCATFFGPITYLIVGIPSVIIDIFMGRRHLLLIFIYPLVSRLRMKGLLITVLFIGILTSMRHGIDHIATSFTVLKNTIFSESYMIFLSSTNHSNCLINIGSNNSLVHFERYTQYCRIMDYAAGGFTARFHYNIMFGMASACIYSFFFWLILKIFYRHISPVLREVLGVIIFTALFITYRDDMGNSLMFLFQYVLLLSVASIILKMLITKKGALHR